MRNNCATDGIQMQVGLDKPQPISESAADFLSAENPPKKIRYSNFTTSSLRLSNGHAPGCGTPRQYTQSSVGDLVCLIVCFVPAFAVKLDEL